MNKIQCGWRSLKGPQRAVVWTHRAQDSFLSGGKEVSRKRSKLKAGRPFCLSQIKLPISHLFCCLLLNPSPLSSCTSCCKVPSHFGWTVEAVFPGILAMCVWKDGILSPLCHSGKEAERHRTRPTQQRPPKSESRQQNVGPMIKNTNWAPIKICILIIAFENTDL